MNKSLITVVFAALFLQIFPENLVAQNYSITVHITNQPDNPILFGSVSGDRFSPIDSARVNGNQVSFSFPADAKPGVFRLVFGKTTYAKLMNEDPQQLDLIFNRENIELKTDFKEPVKNLQIVKSKENALWYDFLSRHSEYEKALTLMEKEVDHYWKTGDSAKANTAANEFNRLQMEWDLRIVQTLQQNSETFAAKLIGMERTPLSDAYLSQQERRESLKKEFLSKIDFSDEALTRTSALSDKLFDYLVLYNRPGLSPDQRTKAYLEAVDNILSRSSANSKVYSFVRNYLVHGFEVLEMPELVKHLKAGR